MDDYHYAWEKLYTSVSILVGPGSQRRRLEDALVSHLGRLQSPQSLPGELQFRYDKVMERLTEIRTVGRVGSFEKNVELLSDDDVAEICEEILKLYDAVCRYQEPRT